MIDPRTSRTASIVDIVVACALIFTVIVTPFEVAFLSPAERVDVLFVLNRLMDIIFFADMVMQFALMYPTDGARFEGSKWEDDPVKIARTYLTSWFLVDAFSIGVSALDWYGVFGAASEGVSGSAALSKFKVLRVVRVLRLVKLARLLRASRILKVGF